MSTKCSVKIVLLATLISIVTSSKRAVDAEKNVPIESDVSEEEGELKQYGTDPVEYLTTDDAPNKNIGLHTNKPSLSKGRFKDVLWKMQWYAHDYRLENGPVMDLNLVPVYDMKITGKGVIIAVVDDGIQVQPDLKKNLMETMSHNYVDGSPGSVPLDATGFVSNHGTKVAGVIAMEADNGICGVGIAHGASIADVKVIGRKGTKLHHEAQGLLHQLDRIDIYSNSWGPKDTADHMDMLNKKVAEALQTGGTKGRSGKGAIYVFPAGNGKALGDSCGADAHINDPHTLAVASASQWGSATKYSESCSAIIATVYSVGDDGDEGIVSTDLEERCTMGFRSRAAAAPIGAAIIALLLQARKELSRRDVMHIITRTAEVAPLADNDGSWHRNGVGFWVSHDFGFGLLNAKNMINLATDWRLVDAEVVCERNNPIQPVQLLNQNSYITIHWTLDSCGYVAFYLEQLTLFCDIDYPYRGALSITLISPSGTEANLLTTRFRDKSRSTGIKEWGFKSLHTWGEQLKGDWQIKIQAADLTKGHIADLIDGITSISRAANLFTKYKGSVSHLKMILRGTTTSSQGDKNRIGKPLRTYAAFRLPNGEGAPVKT